MAEIRQILPILPFQVSYALTEGPNWYIFTSMAARTERGTRDKPWEESVRSKIRTSMLVNRLEAFAESAVSTSEKDFDAKVHLDANRLKAIEILLAKTLPNLSQVESHNQTEVNVISAEPMSPEAWAETYTQPPKSEDLQ